MDSRRRGPLGLDLRGNRRGVSVIELIMVMIIVGIIAGMSVPKLRMTRYRSDATAVSVRTRLQIAQRTGITRQTNVIVSFDLANNRLKILEDNNDNLAQDTGERLVMAPLEPGAKFYTPTMARVYGGTATSAIVGSEMITFGGLPSIILRRDGSSSSDVELYMSARAGTPSEFRAVAITPSTGKVDLFRYTGSAWVRLSQ